MLGIDRGEVGKLAVRGGEDAGSSFSCLTASVTQPSPKLSHAATVTGRAPSMVHIAISIAPVSDAGTIAMRWLSGMPSTWRVRSMARARRALPSLERWERPSTSIESWSIAHPGGFAQGPDEKNGRAGSASGRAVI
jgi:hypothetical protein